jgi:hypothetical protein
MEGGDLCGSVVLLLFLNGKIDFYYSRVVLLFPSFDFHLDLNLRSVSSVLILLTDRVLLYLRSAGQGHPVCWTFFCISLSVLLVAVRSQLAGSCSIFILGLRPCVDLLERPTNLRFVSSAW